MPMRVPKSKIWGNSFVQRSFPQILLFESKTVLPNSGTATAIKYDVPGNLGILQDSCGAYHRGQIVSVHRDKSKALELRWGWHGGGDASPPPSSPGAEPPQAR